VLSQLSLEAHFQDWTSSYINFDIFQDPLSDCNNDFPNGTTHDDNVLFDHLWSNRK